MAKFSDIEKYLGWGNYCVDVSLMHLGSFLGDHTVDINPDFQRGHVWTKKQSQRYIEFLLRGGKSARDILWNCPSYDDRYKEDKKAMKASGGFLAKAGGFLADDTLVLVDGKQRLSACLAFLNSELPVLGHCLSEYTDEADKRTTLGISGISLRMYINSLQRREDLLRWYIELNEGGVVHSQEEIKRVKKLLEKAEKVEKV